MCSVIQLYPTIWTVAHRGWWGEGKGDIPHCKRILYLLSGNPIRNVLSTIDFTHMPSPGWFAPTACLIFYARLTTVPHYGWDQCSQFVHETKFSAWIWNISHFDPETRRWEVILGSTGNRNEKRKMKNLKTVLGKTELAKSMVYNQLHFNTYHVLFEAYFSFSWKRGTEMGRGGWGTNTQLLSTLCKSRTMGPIQTHQWMTCT